MQSFVSSPARSIGGDTMVPGDKSISHRALMLGAIADGRTEVTGFLSGEDCLATMAAVRSMGVEISWPGGHELSIEGCGLHGLSAPANVLDMGNSGTAMRLFAGLLCAQPFDSMLVGDESLTRRPMERVAVPLRQMGADIRTVEGCPPLRIHGGQSLAGIDYAMPVASAQVKSAVLLAGLYASGATSVTEPAVTRDHTERMLVNFGVSLERSAGHVRLAGGQRLRANRVDVPGDLSSAAFLLLAGCLSDSGSLTLRHVGLNPTRTGVLQILGQMGAQIRVVREPDAGGEPVGTLVVSPSRLKGIRIPAELVPLAIDEFPLIFIAAALAEGETLIAGAAELRHKESDRIGRMVEGLRTLGVDVEERPDGARVRGGRLAGGEIDSHGDHRIAMAFAIGGMAADGPVRILNTENVATSFPGFAGLVSSLGLQLAVEEAG